MWARMKLNVPLEFVESWVAEEHLFDEPISIENIEFDDLSRIAVVTVDVDDAEAYKLPWIETDVCGVPV